ncbi:dipeptidylpeptidase, partial [Coemansia sp. RSA 2320]
NGSSDSSTKPLTIGLFHSLSRVGAPVVSPNQKLALFVTSYYNQDSNRSTAYLSYIEIGSGNIVPLTEIKAGTTLSNPLWFDDKTFGFLRRGVLYKQDLQANATAEIVYNPPVSISSASYREDTGLLSFVANVYPNASLAESAAFKRAEETKADSAQVYDNLWARHWNEWMTLEKPNLFVAPLNKTSGQWKVGEEVNLSDLLPHSPDPLTRWHVDEYAISPPGNYAAFLARPPTTNMT